MLTEYYELGFKDCTNSCCMPTLGLAVFWGRFRCTYSIRRHSFPVTLSAKTSNIGNPFQRGKRPLFWNENYSDNYESCVFCKTHFQPKYTFQSQALRKYLLVGLIHQNISITILKCSIYVGRTQKVEWWKKIFLNTFWVYIISRYTCDFYL